ncbi:TetR/AcrR family transcriptional regulator [Albirhodobacter sp. R86504]|uniref:TetR/AcrR family transcriptional regulator n=1 Tax=Albirhodobacter sp. R86504 TaxID=3093848 RepID=UPI003672A5DD
MTQLSHPDAEDLFPVSLSERAAAAATAKDARRSEFLQAGIEVLAESGWQGTTMTKIAQRASASKETIYAWFGDKSRFFEELVSLRSAQLDEALGKSLEANDGDLSAGLTAWGEVMLALLVGPQSIALHRAAIAEAGRADLGGHLVLGGRGASLPRLARWLEAQTGVEIAQEGHRGRLTLPDGALEAAEDYLALLKGDTQLLCLLDAAAPLPPSEIERRARRATRLFLMLYAA